MFISGVPTDEEKEVVSKFCFFISLEKCYQIFLDEIKEYSQKSRVKHTQLPPVTIIIHPIKKSHKRQEISNFTK